MFRLNCKGRLIELDKPVVMGIINTTPDSFYSASRESSTDGILFRAEKMIREGALFLDLGGQSTRPGSAMVSEEEEKSRVIPAVEAIHRSFPDQLISIDTYYAGVARLAVEAGASLINDISAGQLDEDMFRTAAALEVPYVLMHMPSKREHMQDVPMYNQVTLDVFDFLNKKIVELTKAGIKDLIIDPGFGFGKTIAQNFQLLRELSWFTQLGRPVLAGLSRKGTVYKTLGITADEALNGTTVVHTLALMNGAAILRVHDVKEAVEAIKLVMEYKNKEQHNAAL